MRSWVGHRQLDFFLFPVKDTFFSLSPIPSKRRSEHVTCHKSLLVLITIKEDMKGCASLQRGLEL